MDEMNRQTEMAWKRGRDFGLFVGVTGTGIFTILGCLLALALT